MQPFHEPFRTTLLRNGLIALAAATILTVSSGHSGRWPAAVILMLIPALGGHCVELFFLNFLRFRLPGARPIQIAVRIATWFLGGALLAIAMALAAAALAAYTPLQIPPFPSPSRVGFLTIAELSAVGGAGFIIIELFVHLVLQLRGLASFYNGRG